jgi:hypothetical protein
MRSGASTQNTSSFSAQAGSILRTRSNVKIGARQGNGTACPASDRLRSAEERSRHVARTHLKIVVWRHQVVDHLNRTISISTNHPDHRMSAVHPELPVATVRFAAAHFSNARRRPPVSAGTRLLITPSVDCLSLRKCSRFSLQWAAHWANL